jgi:hypothetical protein
MPYSALFWVNFLEVFPKALGGGLGVLPAILGFWGGLIAFICVLFRLLGRWEDRRRDADARRAGRLLPFDESRRARGDAGGRDA